MHIKMNESEIKAACAAWLGEMMPETPAVDRTLIAFEVSPRGEVALTVDVEVVE